MREGEYATIQTKFNYAWGLIKCKRTIDIEKGVRLLTGKFMGFGYLVSLKSKYIWTYSCGDCRDIPTST
jgi:uncharacterized protein YlaI